MEKQKKKDYWVWILSYLATAILLVLAFIFRNYGTVPPSTPVATTTPVSSAVRPAPFAPIASIPIPSSTTDVVAVAPKLLPYATSVFAKDSWINYWGRISISDGQVLDFGSASGTTGGTEILGGGDLWTNYVVEATLNWQRGRAFGIIARFADINNFVYCNFGNNYASVVQRSNNSDVVISSIGTVSDVGSGQENLGIRVYGNKVACDIDGNDVLTAVLPVPPPAKGSMGFTSWDPVVGGSDIQVSYVSVVPLASDTIALITPSIPIAAASSTAPSTSSSTPVSASSTPSDTSSTTPTTTASPTPTLPYLNIDFAGDTNWLGTWGNVTTTTDGTMNIGALADGTGGSAFLTNTNASWANYNFATTLDWPQGETFSLIARYVDNNNYVACLFDESAPGIVNIHLQQYINGSVYDLADGTDAAFQVEGRSNVQASIAIKGPIGMCSLNAHSISNGAGGTVYTLNPPFSGSIGFSTWDPTLGKSEIIVKRVAVTSTN